MNEERNKTDRSGVSFYTNCYEADWKFMLMQNGLKNLIASCPFNFEFRRLVINNVSDRTAVTKAAARAVEENIIDTFYFSEDYSAEILLKYGISRRSFLLDFYDGYWYSLGPLTAMHTCHSEYLLYFTGDCLLEANASSEWIGQAIKVFERDEKVLVANPLWNGNVKEAEDERIREDEFFYYSQGFSDQCFLLPVKKVRGKVYSHFHPGSEMFPMYAGNTFERRLDSYMRDTGQFRITHKFISYIHDNDFKHAGIKKKPILKVIKSSLAGFKKVLRVRTRQFIAKRLK